MTALASYLAINGQNITVDRRLLTIERISSAGDLAVATFRSARSSYTGVVCPLATVPSLPGAEVWALVGNRRTIARFAIHNGTVHSLSLSELYSTQRTPLMDVGNPIESLAAALHAACLRDLPVIEYQDRDWEAHRDYLARLTRDEKAEAYELERVTGKSAGPTITRMRRPASDQCDVVLFPQTWGSTALGYGGYGGCAITTAYTIVVACRQTRTRAVYFGARGRLAYLVPAGVGEDTFREAIAQQSLPSVASAEAFGWLPSITTSENEPKVSA